MTARRAPRAGLPVVRLRAEIAARVGPRHGVQPSPNAMPSRGSSGQPAGWVDGGFRGALEEPEHAEEHEPHQQDHDPEDAGEEILPADEPGPQGAERGPVADEQDGEAEGEQSGPGQRPPPGDPRGGGGAGEVAEVAGHEGEHAGGGEGHQPGEEGEGEGGPDAAGGDDLPHQGLVSARTVSMRAARVVRVGSCPMMRAAIRPVRSRTMVVGTAPGAAFPANAACTVPVVASRIDG